MKTIELLVNKPEFLKGSIITVDDLSAAVLIDKEEAKPYEPAADAEDTDAAQPKVKRGASQPRHVAVGERGRSGYAEHRSRYRRR
ncbi:hypothetical protein ACRYGX_17410 [Mycobacteroides abscessus]